MQLIKSSFRLHYLLLSLFVLVPEVSLAQSVTIPIIPCYTETLEPAVRQSLEFEAQMALNSKIASGANLNTITYVPIRPHILRRANGTGGYSLASLNNVMALTNKYYLQNGNGIQFYFSGTTPDYIDNDALYSQYRIGIDDATTASRDAQNALNQYHVNKFDNPNVGGYARFPANNIASTRTVILNQSGDDDLGNRVVPHELGHTFNLLHTHETAYGNELVTRGAGANCDVTGDLVCDTPADPYGLFTGADYTCVSGCPPNYTCTFVDEQTNTYMPSPTNIMSYYFPCVHDFSAGQYDRIQAGLAMRQAHTAYTLNAPETVMTAPSEVVAAVVDGSIFISWRDNSSNEMGYFIERSTSPTQGFAPIAGVEPNVTSYTDRSFASQTRYYYRIKASNTSIGSISPTATIISTDCRPSFTNDGCIYAFNITGVSIDGTTLSQDSECSSEESGHYSSFTAVSGTITAGQSVPFTITKATLNPMGVTIWVDLNNNNIFEASELLYQLPTPNSAGTSSGSLTIPTSITASKVMMRVVAAYSVSPSDPCGSYGYGETEDYLLTVKPTCIPPVARIGGSTTIITGQTATLTAYLTGTPPFSLTINKSNAQSTVFTDIAASPFSFTVSPDVSTTYTLAQATNKCGTDSVASSASVTVNACMPTNTLKIELIRLK